MSGSGLGTTGIFGAWRSSKVMDVNNPVAVTSNLSSGWKYPGQYDYRQIVRIAGSNDHRDVWQIEDYVDVHGNRRPVLRFEVISSDGRLGFGFVNNGTLAAWPTWLVSGQAGGSQASESKTTDLRTTKLLTSELELRFVPPSNEQPLEAFMKALQSLSTSDWQLLKTLCDLMLTQYAILMMHDRQLISWFKGLQHYAKLLAAVPRALRFDGVGITRIVRQDSYAHLGLTLRNVLTERGRFDTWEFQLATVQDNGTFDANPRLEFSRGRGETAFERWFVESSNAFGDKLEVRFAKQDQLVDLPLVMVRLTDADRRLIAQLIDQLPNIVAIAATQARPLIAEKLGQEGLKAFESFKQVAITMRSIWQFQLGAAQ